MKSRFAPRCFTIRTIVLSDGPDRRHINDIVDVHTCRQTLVLALPEARQEFYAVAATSVKPDKAGLFGGGQKLADMCPRNPEPGSHIPVGQRGMGAFASSRSCMKKR